MTHEASCIPRLQALREEALSLARAIAGRRRADGGPMSAEDRADWLECMSIADECERQLRELDGR